jgi:glycosyltransferase involved in cell wall biosynthesis
MLSMITNNPRVSICIPTYNRAQIVRPSIESALAQTFKDIEIIVIDDASTDNIKDVVASYSDPRLRFIKNSKNLGQFGNFNNCIEISSGEFVHILHSDDCIDPFFTENCVKFFDENPSVHLTFTSEVKNTPSGIVKNVFSDKNEILYAPDGFKKLLMSGCFISCPSVMTRKEVYTALGGFSYEFPIAADYYQWLKIARAFDIGFVKDATLYYNEGIHSESYRFFINNPTGYLDRVKIVMKTITDLKDEYRKFLPELNHQLYVLTFKFLMISVIWKDVNNIYHPSYFLGLAHFSRTLIKPKTIFEHIKKILIYFLIIIINILIYIYPIKNLIKKIIFPFTRKTIYMSEIMK